MSLISKPVLATVLAVSLITSTAGAQHRRPRSWESRPSRFSLVGDLLVAQPKGEFATQLGTNGYGANIGGLFRLDREGIFSIRGDIGGMQYGSETLRVPYLPITGRVALDVETTNAAYWGSIGPQITVPVGPVQPYLNAAIGVMDLVTSTSVRGSDSQYEYASTNNSDDATSAWIFGGGVYVPFGTSKTWKLHAGARYFYGGEATYLKEGDIRDNPDGTVTLFPRFSKTDQVTWQLGVSYTFPVSGRRGRR
ncbi:MAG TPA: outer membrane beta-barrel protein [Gemmatimonadaceae bacterium]|nr:outer membrane beta-barrel protein [Gemmatimonadaceae bacterium]